MLAQVSEPRGDGPPSGSPAAPQTPARITVEPNLNALLVNAPPSLHEEIARLVRLLDRRPPQVMLEAIVVEVSSTHDFNLGVELESVEMFAGSGVGHIVFSQFGLSTVAANGAKMLNPATGFNAALVRPEELPLIVQALERETQARIVSAPRILVNDHQQAVLSRVDEEPFTSTNFRDAVTTTSFSGFAQAGTTLAIVPHISDDNHLLLEYQVQVNTFRGSAAAAGVPPARTTNLAQSSVTIPDGWAIAVGGLVGESDDFAEDRIPFIGDLPVVGVAFRKTTTMKVRRTLFVFLRAYILHNHSLTARPVTPIDKRRRVGVIGPLALLRLCRWIEQRSRVSGGAEPCHSNAISNPFPQHPPALNEPGDADRALGSAASSPAESTGSLPQRDGAEQPGQQPSEGRP